ncbi:MAG: hypothetical protein WBB82_04545 [Limnothrix sp.]
MNPASTWESVIRQIETMDTSEKLNLIHYLVDKLQQKNTEHRKSPRSLVDMIGSGQGCYGSPEKADEFLRQEREQWD